jgi:hypothetical protein
VVQTLLLAGLALAGVALCLVLGTRIRRASGPTPRRDDLDGVAHASTAPAPDLPVSGSAVVAPSVAFVPMAIAEPPVTPVVPAASVITPQAPAPAAVRSASRNNGAARFGRPTSGRPTSGRTAAGSRITNTVAARS